ncbi:MAG: hypothetical protein HN658_05330, partial [Rhodospirillales bacterium]|nr:hypothetical protein [Rhodospirillales bacterium]
LDGFLRRQNINYSDQLYVVAGIDIVTPLAMIRAKTIRSYLLRKGYRSELLDRAEWAGGKIQKANRPTVRIVVHRFVVTAPRCPDWRKTPASDGANTQSSNLGCANTVNLGLMVANPRDLVSGRETGPMDGTRAAAGINRYRNGKVTKLLDSGTTE